MNVFTQPPQLTTAVTDLLIGLVAIYFIVRMKSIDEPRKNRRTIWKAFMWTMSVSGMGGFIIHGFNISDSAVAAAWFPLTFVMFATASMFAIAVFYELLGEGELKKVYIIVAVSNITGYVAMLIASLYTSKFLKIFVIYAGILMIISLASLLFSIIKEEKHYCCYLIAGAAFQIIGGIFEAYRTARFILIWEFDFNSIYHFATIVSIICFLAAYKAGAQYYRRNCYIYARRGENQATGL